MEEENKSQESFRVDDRRSLNDEGELKEEAKKAEEETVEDNKPQNEPSLVQKIWNNDIIGPFIDKGLMPGQYFVDKAGDKIVNPPSVFRTVKHDPPWAYVNNDMERECAWLEDIEHVFGFIPRKCLGCWKVVVVPQTLKELLILHTLQKEMAKRDPYCFCKCGVEIRSDVERNYGGYFYNNSLEAGLARLSQVRANVKANIGAHVPVFLKRACTEFERKYGDSDKWEEVRPAWADDVEEQLAKHSNIQFDYKKQPSLIENHVLREWIRFAAERGDPTVKELNNGDPLYPDYIKYEFPKEEKKDGKKEDPKE